MRIVVNKREYVPPFIRRLKAIQTLKGCVTIAVHDGKFHPDEIIAVAMIKEAAPDINVKIMRTRNGLELNKADICIDVGDGEFDHHTTAEYYPNGVPYAACGKVLRAVEKNKFVINFLNKMTLYNVQAADNGDMSMLPPECNLNYFVWIHSMNPTANEARASSDRKTLYDERFNEALELTCRIYHRLYACAVDRLKNKDTDVTNDITELMDGKIIVLKDKYVRWQKYAAAHKELLVILSPETDGTRWHVRMCPVDNDRFVCRKYPPLEWFGKVTKDLESVTRIKGSIFCHRNGHVMAFEGRDAALLAAKRIVTMQIKKSRI